MFLVPQPAYMPCPECGASVACADAEVHACDEERRLDFKLFQLREEIGAFDRELGIWLRTPRGRFEVWYAERHRAA